MRKALLLLVITVALGTNGCPPESNDGPKLPPMPVIVIGGGTGSPPGGISFEVETPVASGSFKPQTDGGPALGRLRDDFIGQQVLLFECQRSDNKQWVTANAVTATDGTDEGLKLTIARGGNNRLTWTLEDKAPPPPPRVAVLMASDPTPGKVPSEFLRLSASTLWEVGLKTACDKVQFKVESKSE